MTIGSPYRFAGWAAITSGAIGIVAYALLWAAIVSRIRGAEESAWVILFRTHDWGVILQSLLMIPVVFALGAIGSQHSRGVSRATVAVGVAALSLIVLCLLLTFANVIADSIYMVPQGVLGIWLIVVNRLLPSVLPRSLRWLGIVCGVGLVLVAAFPIGYGMFVDSAIFHGPDTHAPEPPGTETANSIVHNVLSIGTFMGVTTYPIWAALVGCRLLRQKSS